MKNICLVIEYIGTKYAGFQRQKNGLSIQEVLENAINLALNEKVKVTPSGRTDAGVHAYNQVVNFFTNTTFPVEKLKIHINQGDKGNKEHGNNGNNFEAGSQKHHRNRNTFGHEPHQAINTG